MGSNPCRIIPLLGIAHPVEGKIILGTEGSSRDGTHSRSWRRRNGHVCPCYVFFFSFFFVKIWVKDSVLDNL